MSSSKGQEGEEISLQTMERPSFPPPADPFPPSGISGLTETSVQDEEETETSPLGAMPVETAAKSAEAGDKGEGADTGDAAPADVGEKPDGHGEAKTPGSKPKAGGVRKVLTSGIFGAGSTKSAPSPKKGSATTAPASRASLAPTKKSTSLSGPAPKLTSSTSRPSVMRPSVIKPGTAVERLGGSTSKSSAASRGPIPTATEETSEAKTVEPADGEGNSADEPKVDPVVEESKEPSTTRSAVIAKATLASSTTKPVTRQSLAASTSRPALAAARTRPAAISNLKPTSSPSKTSGPSAKPSLRAGTVSARPSVSAPSRSNAVTASKRPEPPKASIAGRAKPPSPSSTSTSRSAPKARGSMAPPTSRTPGRPGAAAARQSMAPGMAGKARAGSTGAAVILAKRGDAKEIADLKAQVDELEKRLVEETTNHEAQLMELRTGQEEHGTSTDMLEPPTAAGSGGASETDQKPDDADLRAAEGRIAQLEGKIAITQNDADDHAKKVKEELESLQSHLEAMQAELKAEKEGRIEDAERYASDRATLATELQEQVAKVDIHAAGIAKASNESAISADSLRDLRTAHDQLTSTYQELLNISARHPEDLSDLQTQLEATTAKHDQLIQDAGASSAKRIAELEAQFEASQAEHVGRNQELEGAQAKSEEAKVELENLQSKLEQMEQERKDLEDKLTAYEREAEKVKAENEAKYQAGLEEAKNLSAETHAAQLAAIRSSLHETNEEMTIAHAAELEATSAKNVTAMAALNAEHALALTEVREEKDALQAAMASESSQLKEATSQTTALRLQLEQAGKELDTAQQGAGEAASKIEQELRDAKKVIDDMRDELEGTKVALEMNKSHFSQSLLDLQNQHLQALTEAAENRAKDGTTIKEGHTRELDEMREELTKLQSDLTDERAAKNNALAQLSARTPPTSPPSHPDSPSLTKLHEAHNAKVAELEVKLQKQSSELDGLMRAEGPSDIGGNSDTLGHGGRDTANGHGDDQDLTF